MISQFFKLKSIDPIEIWVNLPSIIRHCLYVAIDRLLINKYVPRNAIPYYGSTLWDTGTDCEYDPWECTAQIIALNYHNPFNYPPPLCTLPND